MDNNQVTVIFTDGTQLNVEAVTRLFGAEWMYAEICVEDSNGDLTHDQIIIQSDKVNYIRCDRTSSPKDAVGDARVHYGESVDREWAEEQLGDLHSAAQLVFPDDDNPTDINSEKRRPSTGPGDSVSRP